MVNFICCLLKFVASCYYRDNVVDFHWNASDPWTVCVSCRYYCDSKRLFLLFFLIACGLARGMRDNIFISIILQRLLLTAGMQL